MGRRSCGYRLEMRVIHSGLGNLGMRACWIFEFGAFGYHEHQRIECDERV
jgi:hypothetical protein